MKKSLIALAAIAAVSAAQADVTLYGALDAGYGTFQTQSGTAATNKVSGIAYSSNETSRWGITTKEDISGFGVVGVNLESTLTGNIRQNFGYEGSASGTGASSTTNMWATTSGILGNNNTGGAVSANGTGLYPTIAAFDRKFNVYFKSGDNQFVIGNDSSLIRTAVVAYQADGANQLGNLVGNDQSLTGGSNGQGRIKSATYTRYMGPMNASFGVVLGTKQDGTYALDNSEVQAANGYQAAFNYGDSSKDKFSVSAAYAIYQAHASTAASIAQTAGGMGSSAAVGTATDVKTKQTVVAGMYDFSFVKAYAEYAKVDIKDNLAAVVTTGGNGVGGDLRSMTSAGVRYPLAGVGVNSYAFFQTSVGSDQYADNLQAGHITGSSYGIKYGLSKGTVVYAMNGNSKAETFSSNTATTATIVESKMFAVGVTTQF